VFVGGRCSWMLVVAVVLKSELTEYRGCFNRCPRSRKAGLILRGQEEINKMHSKNVFSLLFSSHADSETH
jgi:hypothetical protein